MGDPHIYGGRYLKMIFLSSCDISSYKLLQFFKIQTMIWVSLVKWEQEEEGVL